MTSTPIKIQLSEHTHTNIHDTNYRINEITFEWENKRNQGIIVENLDSFNQSSMCYLF